jgi:hypothetical protein
VYKSIGFRAGYENDKFDKIAFLPWGFIKK